MTGYGDTWDLQSKERRYISSHSKAACTATLRLQRLSACILPDYSSKKDFLLFLLELARATLAPKELWHGFLYQHNCTDPWKRRACAA
uniref:Uncharacterized protein n=1 Tax=Anguilla anguilla TaxID=7936 RepID=A0A0E9R382_ANGAN